MLVQLLLSYVSFGRQICFSIVLVLNIFIQTSLDWMQLGHHPSQQQGQITSPVSSPTPQPLIKKNVARGEGGSNP